MPFLERVLEPPSYGYRDANGELYVPSIAEIFREFFLRVNPFLTKKNWLPFWCWASTLALAVPFLIFIFKFFTWPLALGSLAYSMIGLGTHGTIWLHRYSTHRAFKFRNRFWTMIVRNLTIKVVPEEIYVISHHVHHKYPEKPGDPYNALAGWFYCFFADSNHQPIARNLSESDYKRASLLLDHTGVRINTYEQYKRWGSVQNPFSTILQQALNWCFWYGALFLIGGHPLAVAMFGMCVIWAFGIRTFNFDGHGRGHDQRKPGVDFNRADLSVNQLWPGFVAGEWHNNHHLFPNSARSGFLPHQIDFAWYFIRALYAVGIVKSYKDSRTDYYFNYYWPYHNLPRPQVPNKEGVLINGIK
ncbi:MAG: fatty acid desaturase [Bdellovibrionia bacterium]